MRLTVGNEQSDLQEIKSFADWILDIGEGKVNINNDGETYIDIPEDLLIIDSTDHVASLVDFVYPSLCENIKNPEFFQERAILALKHEVAQEINDRLLSMFLGEPKEYLSSDSLCHSEQLHNDFHEDLYSPGVLNGLKLSGLPNHRLVLKVGVPVMLLRNINQQDGLCNGTRLQVVSIHDWYIEAKVISGNNIGKRTFIAMMRLTPTDKSSLSKFREDNFHLLYGLL